MSVPNQIYKGFNGHNLRGWLNDLREAVLSMRLSGDGVTTRVTQSSHGQVVSCMVDGGGGVSTPYRYKGPFALTQKDAENITILGYNEDEGRYWSNYIDVGLADPLEVDEQDLQVLVSGWVWAKITQTAGTYNTPLIETGALLPAQTNTEYYHRLGYVLVENNAISSIEQFQYGGIALPGRIL